MLSPDLDVSFRGGMLTSKKKKKASFCYGILPLNIVKCDMHHRAWEDKSLQGQTREAVLE